MSLKQWRKILVCNFTASVIAGLMTVTIRHVSRAEIFGHFMRSLVIAFLIGTPIALLLERFGAGMYRRRFPANWALILLTILGCSFAGNLAYSGASVALGLLAPHDFWTSFLVDAQFCAVFTLCFGASVFGYRLLRGELETATLELRNRQLEEERARKLAVEAQLASLESHIRPHFLFNTLNTISSLIPDDPELAESLVGNLAALLRLSLDANHERVASLERELKIVADYLEIERARYGDRLRFRIDVPSELRCAEVPALSVQTLVENSVKYAVGPRLEGAEIRVAAYARDGSIIVEVSDDGPGFTIQSIRPGHGLDNLQRRLAALFGPAARLEISRETGHSAVSFCFPRTASQAG